MIRKMVKIVQKVEEYIQEYDKIIVLGNQRRANEIISRLISRQIPEKILLLVCDWEQEKLVCGTAILSITYEEFCSIEKLYLMYEFSDRIYIVTNHDQHGSLDNYVSNGLLTEEEVLTALLQ